MVEEIDILQLAARFDWDQYNEYKNKIKHNVEMKEAEETILDKHSKVFEDIRHSSIERRYTLYGKTKKERLLIVIFTIRANTFRVISARDQNRKERKLYETKN